MNMRIRRAMQALSIALLVMLEPAVASEYAIDIQTEEIDRNTLKITASTNIPGIIEVMGSVSLAGQAADDVYIGESKKFILSQGAGQVVLDVSALPSGKYEAEISFYPRWGFKDEKSKASGIGSNIEVSKRIEIVGSGESAESASAREEGQRWVMLNVVVGTPWSTGELISRFGSWEEFPTKTRNPKIIKNYYFKSIDMTIVVNVLKDEVVTWKMGKKGL